MSSKPQIPIILGATAVGKTAVGIRLAEALNGEIISADSRQLYCLMDIGTAKPTPEETARCRHHLVDFLDPEEIFSAGDFVRKAMEAIEDISGRGKLPLIIGGAGLYIKALIEGIFEGDSNDPEIRKKLNHEYDSGSAETMLERLKRIDPYYSQIVHLNDKKKLVRALEIYEVTGLTISQLRDEQSEGRIEGILCGLTLPREILYQRIEQRVDKMIASGLAEEVENLMKRGLNLEHNSMKSPGYREVIEHLIGNIDYSEMIEAIKRSTRRYAKRQITWFKNTKGIEWFDLTTGIDETTDKIVEYINRNLN